MANSGKAAPQPAGDRESKIISRRQFLIKGALAGASATAALLLPGLEMKVPATVPETAGGPQLTGDGFALMSDASHTGKLLRWRKGVVQAAENEPGAPPNTHTRNGPPYSVPATKQWTMVIDLAKCDGCAECQVACNKFHRIPPGQEWIKIYRLQGYEGGTPFWFPRVCMQCDDPPCVKVCPVGATFKREDGIVLIDQDRCIGCRFCLAACPYSARYFNWADSPETPAQKAEPYDIEKNTPHRRGVAEKCLYCPGLVREGKLPACAAACPMNAIYFGDRNEDAVTNRIGQTIALSDVKFQGAFRYLEDLGTEPRTLYLPPRKRKYPPPPGVEPRVATGKVD